MTELLLASASPRRAELLRRVGLDFDIRPARIDESVLPGESAEDYVLRVAHDKAVAVAQSAGGIVLASDTAVVVDHDGAEQILGKPADGDDAIATLEALSQRWHRVLTSVVVIEPGGVVHSALATARVLFRETTPAERSWYVDTGEPLDCAGSYALQGIGAFMVERIDGDPTTVIGLPLGLTLDLLVAAGVPWPSGAGHDVDHHRR